MDQTGKLSDLFTAQFFLISSTFVESKLSKCTFALGNTVSKLLKDDTDNSTSVKCVRKMCT